MLPKDLNYRLLVFVWLEYGFQQRFQPRSGQAKKELQSDDTLSVGVDRIRRSSGTSNQCSAKSSWQQTLIELWFSQSLLAPVGNYPERLRHHPDILGTIYFDTYGCRSC